MDSTARKLIRALPTWPKRRYTIFAGTGEAGEWLDTFRRVGGDTADDGRSVIQAYEQRFASVVGAPYGTSFGAGRMALFAILEALGIGKGAEVILPAFTCVVVPNAIVYRGANPVYVDIDRRTFNIDVAKVESAITAQTRAILAQHTFGVTCDIEGLRAIGRRHGLPVIEDASHALGAEVAGRRVGSLADAAFFSTDHSKIINTHLGGMAVTNDEGLAELLRGVQDATASLDPSTTRRILAWFLFEDLCLAPNMLWIGRSLLRVLRLIAPNFYFADELSTERPTDYSYPCRLSSAQAGIGLSQIDGLTRNIAHRRHLAGWLESRIGWFGMRPSEVSAHAWLRYSFLVSDRSRFEATFSKRFELGTWFTSVVHGRNDDLRAVGYEPGSCPVAEYAAQHAVNFPTHARIPLAVLRQEIDRNWRWLEDDILYETRPLGASA